LDVSLLQVSAAASDAMIARWTHVSVIEGTDATYVGGDQPTARWDGEPDASTSTRPATGGRAVRQAVRALRAKIGKLARHGGTLQWINEDGEEFTLEVHAADTYEPELDVTYFAGNVAKMQIGLLARPYALGAEIALGVHPDPG